MSLQGAHLNIQLETAAGDPSYYPGDDNMLHLIYPQSLHVETFTDVTVH